MFLYFALSVSLFLYFSTSLRLGLFVYSQILSNSTGFSSQSLVGFFLLLYDLFGIFWNSRILADSFGLSSILSKYHRILLYFFGSFSNFFALSCILPDSFRVLSNSPELLQDSFGLFWILVILLNFLGFCRILSNSLRYSQIFLCSCRFFRIPPDSLGSSQNLVEFFLILYDLFGI